MARLRLVCYVAAFVCFTFATWPVTSRVNLIAAGLALLTLTLLF